MVEFQYAIAQSGTLNSLAVQPSVVPYVDRYGQRVGVTWPDKVLSDQQLKLDAAAEAVKLKLWTPKQAVTDAYGGLLHLGWHVKGTGYYRVLQHDGVWWLITPLGNPCFYTGIDTAPALTWETTPVTGRESIFAELLPDSGVSAVAWGGDPWGQNPGVQSYAFCTSNLIRKYGSDWKADFQAVTKRRLKAWGFTGFGKWSDYLPGVPSTPSLNRTGVPVLVNHPDPFDTSVQSKLHVVLAAQIVPHLNDPTVVAWSFGNEWSEIITPDEIDTIMSGPSNVPAKRALIDCVLTNSYNGNIGKMESAWDIQPQSLLPARDDLYNANSATIPALDRETMRQVYEDTYFNLIESTIKTIDPNHLYCGFWIVPGGWESEADWALMARHCDVIGFDEYSQAFAGPALSNLIAETGKPVFCGEFSFPQGDSDRGFGTFGEESTSSEIVSGRLYTQFVTGAAQNPYCVGLNWFQYRDEPITGRGPGEGSGPVYGENYAFGLVDITDQPKWHLIEAVRNTNLNIPRLRDQIRQK